MNLFVSVICFYFRI